MKIKSHQQIIWSVQEEERQGKINLENRAGRNFQIEQREKLKGDRDDKKDRKCEANVGKNN